MTEHACPLCRTPGTTACQGQTLEPFLRCPACHLLFRGERPGLEDLLRLYPAGYQPHLSLQGEAYSRQQRWALQRLERSRYRLLKRVCPSGGDLLDVGCGGGSFLRALVTHDGWTGLGLDVSWRAVRAAGLQGVCAFVAAAEWPGLPAASFDAVTLWEVIEHVPDPRAALQQIWRLLRPGGTVVMSTPNCESWQARLWGRHWAGWDPPRHLQLFSPATLRRAALEAGFGLYGWGSLPAERYYAMSSAANWLAARQVRSPAAGHAVVQFLSGVLYPCFRLVERTRHASTCVMIARRPA